VADQFFAALEAGTRPRDLRQHKTVEKNRGRQERREDFALPALPTLPGFDEWSNLATIVMVVRITNINGKETGQASDFLSSLPTKVKQLAKLIRQHWSIENQLHGILDVTLTEDASRIRKDHAPQTIALLRRLAVSILSHDTSVKQMSEPNATAPASQQTYSRAPWPVSPENKMRLPSVVTLFEEFAMFRTSDFVDGFRCHLHNMKSVVNDPGFCQGMACCAALTYAGLMSMAIASLDWC
jgi:predicted transposase YbfD/YdcC